MKKTTIFKGILSLTTFLCILSFSLKISAESPPLETFPKNTLINSVTTLSSCLSNDSLILVDLYNATDGANWTNVWDLAQPVSSWYGLTLSGDGCKVTRINLTDNNLNGTIPLELGNLTDLEQLFFHNNGLTGSIPPELGNLVNLEYLALSINQLTGSIPPELGNLTNLIALNLGVNPITGSIPPELGNLVNLTSFNLSNCQLSGPIPSTLGNLTSLNSLYLQNNNLSACFDPNLYNLCSVSNKSLNNNSLLPWEGNFTQFCATGGTTTEQVGAPCDDGNPATINDTINSSCVCIGLIPCLPDDSLVLVELYNATDGANWTNPWDLAQPMSTWFGVTLNDCVVIELDLNNNNLIGFLPAELGMLDDLTKLVLYGNSLTGSIPPELGNLTNLTTLDLFNNDLSGSIPIELGNLSSLIVMGLASNQLTGSIPSELGNLSNLSFLYLNSNQLSGPIPSDLGNLTVNFLFLQNNNLSACYDPNLYSLCAVNNKNFSNNPLLPWQGDFAQFCATGGTTTEQLGAPCDDGDAQTVNDTINMDCGCVGTILTCELNIPLNAGWNIISTNCLPDDASMESIFAPIAGEVIQVKNLTGGTYVPSFSFNTMGDWDITQGYQVKVLSDQLLELEGSPIDPSTIPLNISNGWSMISYLLEGPGDPVEVYDAINNEIVQMKSLNGTYVPSFGFFNSIGDFGPGQGYQVKILSDQTFYYNP